jgi:hypothetical protein
MKNIRNYAASCGWTVKELLDYSYQRVNQRRCTDCTTMKDARLVEQNHFYCPSYLEEWFRLRKVNGFAHTEVPHE